jgi:hypothetical protein
MVSPCRGRLSQAERTDFLLEVLPDILHYIKWEEWAVLDAVMEFCNMHNVSVDG